MRNHNRKGTKKPVLLYLTVAVLLTALLILGVLNLLASRRLDGLSQKVGQLTQSVDEISDASRELTEKAGELSTSGTADKNAGTDGTAAPGSTTDGADNAAAPGSATDGADSQASSQTEGTLSPSRGNSFTNNTDAEMDSLLVQINNLLPADNGSWSVYVCNLSQGTEGSVNNTSMQAASLIKLYIMGAVYESYEALSQQYGTDALDASLNAMITVSDNDAANTLVGYLGGGDTTAGMNVVNQFCQSHGFTQTSMGRLLLAGTENGDNYTSVQDCGRFLKAVYQLANGGSSDVSLARADSMFALLNGQTRRNKIPAQLPEGVSAANKTGELSDVENDAAIIYNTAKGVNLVVCFMSEHLSDAAAAQNSIAQNARMIYGFYNE